MKILLPSCTGSFQSSCGGVPRGPHADMAVVASGPPWPGLWAEVPLRALRAFNFLRDQSCGVKGGGSARDEQKVVVFSGEGHRGS